MIDNSTLMLLQAVMYIISLVTIIWKVGGLFATQKERFEHLKKDYIENKERLYTKYDGTKKELTALREKMNYDNRELYEQINTKLDKINDTMLSFTGIFQTKVTCEQFHRLHDSQQHK